MSRPTSGIDEIYFAALERESREARAAYLDEVCGSDPDLRGRVERLLEAQSRLGNFLAAPAVGQTISVGAPTVMEGPGTSIGPYKPLETIGEGGMGVVYMAEQTEPVRRKVALKVIKPGMDTKQVIARFEAERQALAMMDHPHIAHVYDAGATGSGRPYFVMELVRGIPITEYCDRNRLTIPDRLRLFARVCQAVQHAHQKGIIHRDIKPTNVLVTSLDGVPLPKVIDFGIAKATGPSLTDKTLFTGFAQLIGTPLYMSPEQAEMSAVDVDTRSDVYSLGVLLYKLLTGTTPFDQTTFKTAALDEVRRIIREQEPPEPSTRLGALGATITTVSGNRRTDPRRLDRSLRGELDWIVMRALDKDRTRRYETASGLARDVERYLAGDPVEAGPPSAWYRFRKFTRRNRAALMTLLLVALTLISGTAVSAWQTLLARRARIDAIGQRDRAITAEAEALSQRDEARRQRERALTHLRQARESVDQMLTEVGQSTLSQVPHMEPVRRALLEKALKFYEQLLVQEGGDPAIRLEAGRAYRRVGEIRRLLGQHDGACEACRRSIAILDELLTSRPTDLDCGRELAESHSSLGESLAKMGKSSESDGEYRRAISLRQAILDQSPDGVDDRFAWACAEGQLGTFLRFVGRLRDASESHRMAREALERLVADSPDEPRYRSQLGKTLHDSALRMMDQQDYEQARLLFQRAITHHQADLKADPRDRKYRTLVQNSHEMLAMALMFIGERVEAERYLRQCVSMGESLVSDFPLVPGYREDLAGTYGNLATLLMGMGPDRHDEAFRTFDQAGRLFQTLAAEYPGVPSYRFGLAELRSNGGHLLRGVRRWKDAERSFREALEIGEALVAAEPTNAALKRSLANYKGNLAHLLVFRTDPPVHDPSRAARLAQEAIRLMPEKGVFLLCRKPVVGQSLRYA